MGFRILLNVFWPFRKKKPYRSATRRNKTDTFCIVSSKLLHAVYNILCGMVEWSLNGIHRTNIIAHCVFLFNINIHNDFLWIIEINFSFFLTQESIFDIRLTRCNSFHFIIIYIDRILFSVYTVYTCATHICVNIN